MKAIEKYWSYIGAFATDIKRFYKKVLVKIFWTKVFNVTKHFGKHYSNYLIIYLLKGKK